MPTARSGPEGITVGPDGALWFAEGATNKIGRITTSGSITEYPVPAANSGPYGITAGPDGALWFTEYNADKIGRITTAGSVTEYPVPTANSGPLGITAASDGAIWFAERQAGKIGRITTGGSVTEYTPPSLSAADITTGPDGALWFTEIDTGKIGRYSLFNVSSLSPSSATAEGPAFTLTVDGSGFASGAVVDWNGSPLAAAYVNATELTAFVSAGLIATPGIATVTVISGGVTSNSLTFTVNAMLAINSLSPSSVPSGGPPFTMTVNGSGFTSGAVVDWNGSSLSTAFIGSTELTASVPASLIASQGTATITVVLNNRASAQAKLTVTAPTGSQCTNIGGAWNVSESGSANFSIVAPIESDSFTDPASGTGSVSITQIGCSIQYGPIAGNALIASNATPSNLASAIRTGTVSGNNVSVAGIVALVETAQSARAGLTIYDVSSNLLTADGQVAGNVITLNETGNFEASGFYSLSGQTGPFTLKITTSSTAVFTRSAGTEAPSAPSITSRGIVPVDSTVNTIQAGAWVSIFGTNFASSTASWNGNFPVTLGGASVTIDGKSAYLSFVSPTQINVQAPDDTTTGVVQVIVTTSSGVATSTVMLAPFAPSLLLLDGKHVAGIIPRSDGSGAYGGGTYDILGPTGNSLGYKTVAAKAGDTVALYALGLGPTDPVVPAGQAFSSSAATTHPVNLLINNVSATPSFAGLSGAGVYQINLTVPDGLGTGDVSLAATVGGAQSQPGVVMSLQ